MRLEKELGCQTTDQAFLLSPFTQSACAVPERRKTKLMKAQSKLGKRQSEPGKTRSEFPKLWIRLIGAWKSLVFFLIFFFILFLPVSASKREG